MIQREKILSQLHEKKGRFVEFNTAFQREADVYEKGLEDLAELTAAALAERLTGADNPGALPTEEFDAARDLRLRYPETFANHQEARTWAHAILLGHTTFAVDGSQIDHDRNFNIPVAAVQAAWFENHHAPEGRYAKDTVLEVLSPEELIVEFDGAQQISEQQVNLRRFELEVETLCGLMKKAAAERTPGGRLPVAFFDSSLIISFVDRLQDQMRDPHVEALLKLLRCSEDAGIPLVGYVDASDARDLVKMIERCFALPRADRIHDAALVQRGMNWGDRTPLFVCARRGADQKRPGVLDLIEADGHRIGFTYLKTTAAAPPARIDVPMWVHERGLLDEVLDLVRAEAIVGNGYPYVIEAADAAAVLTARDRDAFYAIFQHFAEEQGLRLRITQKAASKARRR
ncbi:MAG: DNA double-strand break repair nuclease NurA [Blastocatellia bacterium]|nr:DNA double-strand break repair nuclease NurA [Blastocatellia bacterium]